MSKTHGHPNLLVLHKFTESGGIPQYNGSALAMASDVLGLLDFKGSTDASGNPNYPAASKGDSYLVSVAGKVGGASGKVVEAGDVYIAKADNAGGTEAGVGTNWFVLQNNLTGITAAGVAMIQAADADAQAALLTALMAKSVYDPQNAGKISGAGASGSVGGVLSMVAQDGQNAGNITTDAGTGGIGGAINTSGSNGGAGGGINTSAGANGSAGSINTSDLGGSINTSGGAGGAGGSIDTRSDPVGGVGGAITTKAGSGAGSPGGLLYVAGGAGASSTGGAFYAPGGGGDNSTGCQLNGQGGATNGARSGNITVRGDALPGGDIDTHDGGGSINTRGVGLIELGEAGQRTSVVGLGGGNRTVVLFKDARAQGSAPTVNDDITEGYTIGSRWFTIVGGEYVCTDDTDGAAVWLVLIAGKETGFAAPGSAGDKTQVVADYTAVDFDALDATAFGTAYPETADALTALSTQLAALTKMQQAQTTAFRDDKQPSA